MRNWQVFNIFLVICIIMMGFGLIMPLLPYVVADYGGSTATLGLLVASFALGQVIGSPVLGRVSDRSGRRPVLILSMGGMVLSFALLGLADPLGRGLASLLGATTASQQNAFVLGVLFFSRLLGGLTGGMITAAQAYITDVTDAEHRTQALGLIGAAFALGTILGPVLGGVLSKWGFALPALVAAGLAVVSLLAIVFLLPESLTAAQRADLAAKPRKPAFDFAAIARKMRAPRVGPLLNIRFFSSLSGALFMTMFALWAKERLGLGPQPTSYLLAYLGLLSIVVQTVLIGPLTKRFNDARLITWAMLLMGIGMLAWAFTPSVGVLIVVLIPQALGMGLLNTVINSAISWTVSHEEMGDALGTAAALESLARVIAPSLGGWLIGGIGTWSPGLLAGLVLVALTAYGWQRLIVRPDPAPEPVLVAA